MEKGFIEDMHRGAMSTFKRGSHSAGEVMQSDKNLHKIEFSALESSVSGSTMT